MVAAELQKLIDEGLELSESMAIQEARLKTIKSELKAEAARRKETLLIGKIGAVVLSPYSKSTIKLPDLRELLTEHKMVKKLIDCMKIDLTKTRKIVPAHLLSEIEEKETDEYGKISFKRR
jgi:hypothetical protein